MNNMAVLRRDLLSYLERMRCAGAPGRYRYSATCREPTLYASTYAARIRSLFNDLAGLASAERQAWIEYFQSHQDNDGLYRDPLIYGKGWYTDDPLWCGRTHLTGHVLAALTALGGVAGQPLFFLEPYRDAARLEQWLESRDWGERVDFTGNEICNIGRLLQYARDFHNDAAAGRAAAFLLDWLEDRRFHPASGLWGVGNPADPLWRSRAVQGAYHWWILYFYDRRPVPGIERAIDTLFQTQNPQGGFGWGVHNPQTPYNSSACEDIDSIHPLAQFSVQTDYRRADIRAALERAADWVLCNRMPDGGFVFMLDRDYAYGHEELFSPANISGLFPTWFRTLSLAFIGQALPDHLFGRYPWHFDRCPGPQIWNV